MRKYLTVVALLVLVAIVGAVTTTTDDEGRIVFVLKMRGLAFQILSTSVVKVGNSHTAGPFNAGTLGSVMLAGTVGITGTIGTANALTVDPCEKANLLFGIENTGGITLDINATRKYSAGPAVAGANLWTFSAWSGAGTGFYACNATQNLYEFEVGTSGITIGSVTAATSPNSWKLWGGVGLNTIQDLVENLVSEAPGSLGDGSGNWVANERDIWDLYVAFLAPITVNTTTSANGPHRFHVVMDAVVGAID